MSPPKHSQPSGAHWAAVLQQARVELELLSGETFTLPGAPKQAPSSTTPDEIPWSVVVKKKGKKGKRKGKKKVSTGPSPAKAPSHSICGSFKEPVTWHTRDVMKARTEWKHKKQRVYTYTSLPKDFSIYQDTKTLSPTEKRRIISGHRFHEQDELQRIPEDNKLFLTKPRLPRVNPIPHQRQGPVPVDLGVSAPIPTKSLWSQVAAKPAVTKPTVPTVPEIPAKAHVTSKKKTSQTLGGSASKVSPFPRVIPKLPTLPVDSTLRRQGPVPVDFQDDNNTVESSAPKSNKSLWSQVAAKPAVSKAPVKPEVPVKPRVKPTLRRQGPVVPIVFNDNKEDEANSPSPASNKSLWSQVAAKPAVPQAPIKPAVKPPVSRTMKRSQTLGLPVSRDVELSPAPVTPEPKRRP